MKKVSTLSVVIISLGIFFISTPSFSLDCNVPDGAGEQLLCDLGNSMSGLVQEFPLYSTIFPGSMGGFLCDTRCMFKGPLGAVIVATAIFIMGVTILIGKFKWPTMILIVFCIAIFSSAEVITEAVINSSFLGVINVSGNEIPIMGFMPKMCQCLGNLLMDEINDDPPPTDPCYVPPGQPKIC
jgi:type IV secretory pathway VirB2 component (pilin)